LGVAFDKPALSEKGKAEIPKEQIPRYAMSLEIPIIRNLQGVGGGGGGGGDGAGGGGGGQQRGNSFIITSTGNEVWGIERTLSKRLGRENFYGHMKVIVIGEDLAREGIREILDFFVRRREIHGRISLVIAREKAKKVLEVTPLEENFSSLYLERLLSEAQRSQVKIEGDFLKAYTSLISSGNAVLPRVRASSNTQIIVGGAAVIKDWKLAGWLSELETSGVNIVNDEVMGGSITVVDPQREEGLIVVRIVNLGTQRAVEIKGNKPVFTLNIFAEGGIVEKSSINILFNKSLLDQVERRAELEIQRRAFAAIDKLQREYKADIFGFDQMVAKKFPRYWNKIKKEWDGKYFAEAEVIINVDVKVRRMGTVR
ncbi:MAG: Ger(x)C family spore germination protein, partial [Clostridia bacterium]|nr:Ger(x)C family spore germination protein [Clostridia bacterium]